MSQNLDEMLRNQNVLLEIQKILNSINTNDVEKVDYQELKEHNDLAANEEMRHSREMWQNNKVSQEMFLQRDLKSSWTFSTMTIDNSNENQVSAAKEFINQVCITNEEEQAPNLIIMGQGGSGKSHLAGAIAHELMIRNKKILFVNFNAFMYQLLDDNKSDYCRRINEDISSNSYDVVVLDDVITNSDKFTDYRAGRLATFIRTRNIANKSIVLVVNCPEIHVLRLTVGEYCFGSILDMMPHVINMKTLFYRKPVGNYDPLMQKISPNTENTSSNSNYSKSSATNNQRQENCYTSNVQTFNNEQQQFQESFKPEINQKTHVADDYEESFFAENFNKKSGFY